jgi:hypothetical protein
MRIAPDLLLVDDETAAAAGDRRWQVDRKISLGLIFALLVNLGTIVWFARGLDARLAAVETWTQANAGTAVRLSVIETKLDLMLEKRRAEIQP